MVEIIVIGLAIAFNFIILYIKYQRKRYGDLFMDVSVLLMLAYLFGGTIMGMAAAMVGGMLVSIFLFFAHKPKDENTTTYTKYKPRKSDNIRW